MFHSVLEGVGVAGWQVVDEGNRLRVLLARPGPSVDPRAVEASVVQALVRVGLTSIPVDAAVVDTIPRTPLGKAPLVRRAAGGLVGDATA